MKEDIIVDRYENRAKKNAIKIKRLSKDTELIMKRLCWRNNIPIAV